MRAGKRNRDRQPLRSLRGLEAVPVLPLVLLVLHGVEPDEQVCLVHLVEVPEPGHELGLVDRHQHGPHPAPRTKIGFEVSVDVGLRTSKR
jgi:hypothetical protein